MTSRYRSSRAWMKIGAWYGPTERSRCTRRPLLPWKGGSGHPSERRQPHVLATAAGIYGLEGRKNEAEKLIDEVREIARHQYVYGGFFAEAYVGIGQKDQAVA